MKKILIIEDDEFLGDVLSKKLNKAGFETIVKSDGREGLSAIYEIRPDLVLLDIILPTMNGYEILEEWHKDISISEIPVIIISNSGQPVEISRVVDFGVKSYVVKADLNPEEVLEKVEEILGKSGDTKEGEAVPSTVPAPVKKNGKTILLVEDDSFLSDIIARRFSNEGFTLLHAQNGEEAIELLKNEVPRVIVLDLTLPGMQGYEVLEKIRTDARLDHSPAVILSNLEDTTNAEQKVRLKIAKHLLKARFNPDDIVVEIQKIIAE